MSMGMTGSGAGSAMDAQGARRIFERIGDFLDRNRLGPEPLNYEFAYRVESDPAGPLAATVRSLTEDGVRLTRKDIVSLGGDVAASKSDDTAPEPDNAIGQGLVARTQMQVESFQDLMTAMHAETRGFGRDLAASADALRSVSSAAESHEVMRLTGMMVDRINSAESRLEAATREASELRRKLEEARDNARRDPLTSLPNRRALEEYFTEKTEAGGNMCIAICDIDRFKQVNDGFGHAVGDRVLKAIGELIAEHCSAHMVARYGGEEFAVLFDGVDMAGAHECLEKARLVVAAKRYRLRETDAPLGAVTFSAGLTGVQSGEAFNDAFVRADRLLYAAKADGRNCLKTG